MTAIDTEAKERFLTKYLFADSGRANARKNARMIWDHLMAGEQIVYCPAAGKRCAYYRLR